MKLPWYMKSKNKATTIIILWYGVLIIRIKRLFRKSKLRKRVEFYIDMLETTNQSIRDDIEKRGIKRTLNPAEYAKSIVMLKDNQNDIDLLKEILK